MIRFITAAISHVSRLATAGIGPCTLALEGPCRLARLPHTRALATAPARTPPKHRPELSRSHLPELNEDELEETWVRGELRSILGPSRGGGAVVGRRDGPRWG